MFMGSWGLLVVPDLDVSKVTDFTETFGEAGGQCRQVTKLGFKGIASDINLGDKIYMRPRLANCVVRTPPGACK